MITTWLVKVFVGIALLGAAVFELGSPAVTRAQADGAAHEIADNVAGELFQQPDVERAGALAAGMASSKGVRITSFEVADGAVRVTVSKEAKSYVLRRLSATKDWYSVTASAAARVPR